MWNLPNICEDSPFPPVTLVGRGGGVILVQYHHQQTAISHRACASRCCPSPCAPGKCCEHTRCTRAGVVGGHSAGNRCLADTREALVNASLSSPRQRSETLLRDSPFLDSLAGMSIFKVMDGGRIMRQPRKGSQDNILEYSQHEQATAKGMRVPKRKRGKERVPNRKRGRNKKLDFFGMSSNFNKKNPGFVRRTTRTLRTTSSKQGKTRTKPLVSTPQPPVIYVD